MAPRKEQSGISLDGLPFQVHFNPADIDEFIVAHSIPFIHYRAMRCPGGMKHKYDARNAEDCHLGCSHGYLYTQAGTVLCASTGNSSKLAQYDPGLLTGSSISVTPPRYYADERDPTRPVQLLQFDRMYLTDDTIVVPMWETFEAHQTGVDRLRFPVVEVVDLIDNLGRRYQTGDFQVSDGKLVWGQNRPGEDPDTGKGRVCSVRYLYRPYWYVSQLVHEVRVSTVDDPDGKVVTARLPQSAILQREYLFETEARDPQAPNPDSPRQAPGPYNGGFSAR